MSKKLFALLGKVKIGDQYPVRTVGVINVGPESFYQGSIRLTPDKILQLAWEHKDNGASIIDVGGASSAPASVYSGVKEVGVSQELERIKMAFQALKSGDLKIPLSVDTQNNEVAEMALSSGASIVNDISGLKRDPKMAQVVANYEASLVLMATQKRPGDVKTIEEAKTALRESIHLAKTADIDPKRMVIDPSIGAWDGRDYRIDLMFLKNLTHFRTLGYPLFVAISRKSFIGQITGIQDPRKRLIGSIAATAIAVFNGCHIVRTHDVKETMEAIQVAEALRDSLQEDF
ncbi:MAG: dihydropteroate synthase [Candidatus Heimdallarchaeota archaeon]